MSNDRCTVDANRVINLCSAWNEHIGRSHGMRGGGADITTAVDLKTHKIIGTRLVIYAGDHTKRGTKANFCPWCGASYAKANGYTAEGEPCS